nr:hypothetical protein Iba_chr13fCG9090 [Ipomoea batatas]
MSNANNQLPTVSSSTTPIFIPITLPAIQTSTSIPFTLANHDVESHNNPVVPVSPVILQDNASSFGDRAHTSSRDHVQSTSSSAESAESISSIPQSAIMARARKLSSSVSKNCGCLARLSRSATSRRARIHRESAIPGSGGSPLKVIWPIWKKKSLAE